MKIAFFILAFVWILSSSVQSQEIINIYPAAVPNSKDSGTGVAPNNANPGLVTQVVQPTLEVYLPEKDKANGAAIIICPGGGYSVIVYQGEGISTAKQLAQQGITAFVLKYRLPDDTKMTDKKIGPLQDAQQSIKYVRENAARFNIDPKKIGIMGFSAGGHLAATEATHYKTALIDNVNNTSLRPDFQILVYPVISMQDQLTHRDSRTKLLGSNPSKEDIDLFSNELQVDDDTPPCYITHAADDKLVDVDNSIQYFEMLRHHNVPVEMHIFPKGGHGFIFGYKAWIEPLKQWMKDNKLTN
jgi:acetyl esterase/lipase